MPIMRTTTHRVYYTETIETDGEACSYPLFQDHSDIMLALKLCADLRALVKEGRKISFIVMASESTDMVGEMGVTAAPSDYSWRKRRPPDHCEVCHGDRGGVRGNENVVGGQVICDYCHADKLEKENSE